MTTQRNIERSNSNTLPVQQPEPQPPAQQRQNRWYYSPHADVYETGTQYTIILDMPGVPVENVELTCEGRTLIVRGRIEHQLAESMRPIRTEYGIGDYFRRFDLGDSIDINRITAGIHESGSGAIVVHLPKVEQAKPIRIEVKQ